MRGRLLRGAIGVCFLLVASATVAGAHGTHAPPLELSDSDCTWQRNDGTWADPVVHVAQAGTPVPNGETFTPVTFPGDVVHEGRLYSFVDRIEGAVAEYRAWRGATDAGADFNLRMGTIGFAGNPDANGLVVVYYVQNDINDYRPSVVVIRKSSRNPGDETCSATGPTTTFVLRAHVRAYQYNFWHTAEVRGAWESCLTQTNKAVNYLCGNDRDFQESITHELGHVLGMKHPDDINSNATLDAHCYEPKRFVAGGNPAWRLYDTAIMCPAGEREDTRFTTHRRTFGHEHNYDVETYVRQFRDQCPC